MLGCYCLPCSQCRFYTRDFECKRHIKPSSAMDSYLSLKFRPDGEYLVRLGDACSFFQQKKEKVLTESEAFRILRKASAVQLELF